MIMLSVELEQEDDGRWIAEVAELPGVLAYGETPGDARAKAQALTLRVFADHLEQGKAGMHRPKRPAFVLKIYKMASNDQSVPK